MTGPGCSGHGCFESCLGVSRHDVEFGTNGSEIQVNEGIGFTVHLFGASEVRQGVVGPALQRIQPGQGEPGTDVSHGPGVKTDGCS